MNFSPARILLHLEGLGVLVGVCFLYAHFEYSWGRFTLFLLAPDLSMLALLVSRPLGVACYNAVHTYLGPLSLLAALAAFNQPDHAWIALVWTAHIGMDRVCGYGLRYGVDFKLTHLQRV